MKSECQFGPDFYNFDAYLTFVLLIFMYRVCSVWVGVAWVSQGALHFP